MSSTTDPLQGVTLSEAAAEAAAIAPLTRAMLDTLEFHRSTFVDGLGAHTAIRLVVDKQDLTATLEADAPLDAGEDVLFKAIGLRVVKPPENDSGQSPTFSIEIDGVSNELLAMLDEDLDSSEPILMIYRVYASDDTSTPAVLPVLRLELLDVNVNETRGTLTCGFADPINEAFPSVTYLRRQYPGLAAR